MAKSSTQNRGTRLPEDWWPTEDLFAWAAAARPDLADQLTETTEMFKDFWLAEPNGRKLDWNRTWRNWIRRATRLRWTRNGGCSGGGVVL